MKRKTLRIVLIDNIEKSMNHGKEAALRSALMLAERDDYNNFLLDYIYDIITPEIRKAFEEKDINLLMWFAYWLGREHGKDATYNCLIHTLKDKTERDPRTYH